jgi:hypothetical protein
VSVLSANQICQANNGNQRYGILRVFDGPIAGSTRRFGQPERETIFKLLIWLIATRPGNSPSQFLF